MSTMPEENNDREDLTHDQGQDPLVPEPETSCENTQGDEATARIKALQTELDNTKDQMLRAVAEADNTRKRLMRERDDVRKYAVAEFAKDLLDFADNFRRALESIPADALEDDLVKNVVGGIEAMEKSLVGTLEKHGITKTEPLDEMFNPNFHEAMFEAPGTGKAAGTIIEVIEPGYMLQDRLLRPARVGIAKDDGTGGGAKEGPGNNIDMDA